VILSGSTENSACREDQLGDTLMQAQNGAQRAVFDTGPEATSYASELLDRDTASVAKKPTAWNNSVAT
jgi:hypothetical protein